jgi:hypothetical protein
MAVVDFYPHQLKAIGEMHNGCVVRGGVGTGKTRTALGYFQLRVAGGGEIVRGHQLKTSRMAKPYNVVVITTARKRDSLDWEGEAAKFGLSVDPDLHPDGMCIRVDSWNNIVEYIDYEDTFFIFDEQRVVGSGAWSKAFIKIAQRNRWILLSATPGDTWLDYIPVFVANGFYKNRTEFLRRHVVYNNFAKFPKVDHFVEEGLLQKHRAAVLVEMPYPRHTKRHIKNILVDYDQAAYERVTKDRWHIFENRPIKDVGEMFRLMRQVVNSDPSRLGALMSLMEKHPRLIVFYNFNFELDALRTLASTVGIEMAEWNGQNHQEVPSSERWLYLVQYTAGAEAWNCISTDAIVFYSLNYSYKINEQAKGRIDRLDTPFVDLYYYILRSNSTIDAGISRSISTKRNFNEKEFEKWQNQQSRSKRVSEDEMDELERRYSTLRAA